ncbi:hypothetical protein B0H19DRAFT_1268902 [Mycena capillaripes]|nr:hypothetical protein B0H19DRAFT_1268902 [Mycena capillaripes]
MAAPRIVAPRQTSDTPIPGLSTGLPLTITLSLDPSPTLTQAAVSSAYSSYATLCGPKLAQAYQDALAWYAWEGNPAVTDFLNDPAFQQFLVIGDGELSYEIPATQCDLAGEFLLGQEFGATGSDVPTPTADVDAPSATVDSETPQVRESRSAKETSPPATSQSSMPNAGLARSAPGGVLLLAGGLLALLVT